MSTSPGSTARYRSAGAPGALDRARGVWLARLATVLLAALGLALGGCGGADENADAAALTPEQFVEVIVALREAEREVVEEDSAAALFEERKRAILERHDTTEDELQQFIAAHRDDLAVLQAAWDTITERLKYARPDSESPAESWDEMGDEAPADPDDGAAAERPLTRRSLPSVPGGADVH